MARRAPKNTWILILSGVLALALVVALVLLDSLATPIAAVIRSAALFGYLAVFLASISSLFIRELTRYFGRSFIKVHHVVSVAALVALATHATAVAWRAGTPATFVPRFDSLRTFLNLGGRPAFWFLAVTALTALFRTSIGKSWKTIHWLNYLAFLLGTVHGQLIGANFQYLAVRIVSGAMAIAIVVAFVWKRIVERRRRQRIARARESSGG